MKNSEIIVEGGLTGTISEKTAIKKNEFGESFDAIQQTWRINPADEEEYKGRIGYKDA